MAHYRIRREHVQCSEPSHHRPALVELHATEDGLTLKQVLWKDLPKSTFGRPAAVLIGMREDSADPAFILCETRDVILVAGPEEPSS